MLNLVTRRTRTSRPRIITVGLSLLLLSALTLSGCFGGDQRKKPPVSAVFDPEIRAEFQLDEWAWAERPDHVISPDGKYALLGLYGESGQDIAAIPLDVDDHRPIVMYSAPRGWTDQSALQYRTLGWSADGKPLFVAAGWQNQGPNTGKRGIALLSGDLTKAAAEEIAFLDLPQGELHTATYVESRSKVFLVVSGAIWAYDMNGKKLEKVKVDLPTYDGLFYARISPDGKYFVYELHEESKSGVYLLNAESGVETALLQRGETMSFVPFWSPDGKYVAVYTVHRKAGQTGNTWMDYDFYAGEDGPLTISPQITVVDTTGKVVRTVSLEGKVLANFKWSSDSKSLAFVAGPRTSADLGSSMEIGMPNIPWDGIWTVAVTGSEAPLRLALLDPSAGADQPSFVYPLTFDAKGKAVYFQANQGENFAVLYARPGSGASTETPLAPFKIADGYWHFQYSNPVFGEYTAAIITGDTGTGLWFLGPDFRKMDEWSTLTTELLGYNDETLLLYRRGETGSATVTVVSVFK